MEVRDEGGRPQIDGDKGEGDVDDAVSFLPVFLF